MNGIFEKGMRFIWENARLLERAIFEYRFCKGSPSRILHVLKAYQNEDGSFGHALEPDLRAPDGHPLFIEFALRTLYECRIRDHNMVYKVCDFLSKHADFHQGIPTIFSSSQQFPRAAHWNNPASEQPSCDRLTGLVGLVNWHKVEHPWLHEALNICETHVASAHYDDAHTILNALCLIESLSNQKDVNMLRDKLSRELFKAKFFCLDVPVRQYGLTPLSFAPLPDSYCRDLFSDAQIDAHLNDLESKQEEDGGWPIQWEPPGEMARLEWRAYKTVYALITLRAYTRI